MRTPAQATASMPTALTDAPRDHRGSPIPTGAMIATRFMELRKRRGLMIALIVVNIGIPTVFLVVRLLAHAIAPKSYGPAGGYSIYTSLVAGVMYVFGFIVAATLGCTAGSVDLSEGMFRHLVVTGRSRLALYLARIPAGLAIVVPLVAIGFIIVCSVCVFAAPTKLNYDGVNVPAGLSRAGLENWAADHPSLVMCDFGLRLTPSTPDASEIVSVMNSLNCGGPVPPNAGAKPSQAEIQGCSRPGSPSELLQLRLRVPVPVRLAHDQVRVVARTRSAHRVDRGVGTRFPAWAKDYLGHPHDRARGHPDADLLPSAYSSPVELAAGGGRSRHRPPNAGWPSGVGRRRRRAQRR